MITTLYSCELPCSSRLGQPHTALAAAACASYVAELDHTYVSMRRTLKAPEQLP